MAHVRMVEGLGAHTIELITGPQIKAANELGHIVVFNDGTATAGLFDNPIEAGSTADEIFYSALELVSQPPTTSSPQVSRERVIPPVRGGSKGL